MPLGKYWRSSPLDAPMSVKGLSGVRVMVCVSGGGVLDAAVEPAGEGSFEAAADVAVGLALGGALGLVLAGLRVAVHEVPRVSRTVDTITPLR